MNEIMKEYLAFINEKLTEYNRRAKTLEEESKADEATFLRIRANICDIFHTLIGATDKKVKTMKVSEDELDQVFSTEYIKYFETIPASWKLRLAQADRNQDSITATIEEVKLDTADMLRNKFLSLTGGASND
jgi:hypothetical protein